MNQSRRFAILAIVMGICLLVLAVLIANGTVHLYVGRDDVIGIEEFLPVVPVGE